MYAGLRLSCENLSCERGGRLVFSGVNFTLVSGEMLELRGTNGSGKSSLLRLLAGLNFVAEGQIAFTGGPLEVPLNEQAHYIGHADAIKPALSVRENLEFWAQFLSGDVGPALLAFNLQNLVDDQAVLLSAGQKRRLALSRLLVAKRPLWLLDEPSVGLDTASLKNLQILIQRHLTSGGMVIAATHMDIGVKSSLTLTLGGTT
jgi:heme exporter protein A